MIIDCHSHIWSSPAATGQADAQRPSASPADHALAARCVEKSLVLGSMCDGGEIPNEYIAQYISRDNARLIGIAGIDPTANGSAATAEKLLEKPEFRGLVCSPASQNFHPADSRTMALYALAQERGAPIFFDNDPPLGRPGRMDFARPYLLDEIAREFPRLTMVVCSLGHPWVEETISLITRHERVFADIASLLRKPWQAYNAMVLSHQFGAMDKILFGSDFPYYTAQQAIETVYRLHEMSKGTNLPVVPREDLRNLIERNSLKALGIARAGEETDSKPIEEDEET